MFLGFWMLINGRPYGQAISGLHKLSSVVAGIGFGIIAYGMLKNGEASFSVKISLAVTGLFFILSVASGAVLITIKNTNIMVLLAHRVLPFLTYICGLLSLYLLKK